MEAKFAYQCQVGGERTPVRTNLLTFLGNHMDRRGGAKDTRSCWQLLLESRRTVQSRRLRWFIRHDMDSGPFLSSTSLSLSLSLFPLSLSLSLSLTHSLYLSMSLSLSLWLSLSLSLSLPLSLSLSLSPPLWLQYMSPTICQNFVQWDLDLCAASIRHLMWKTLCNFEPETWLEIITSSDAQSACLKDSRW